MCVLHLYPLDLPVLLHALHGCYSLQCLALTGNPVTEEPSFKKLLHKAVPSLLQLDGYKLKRNSADSRIEDTCCVPHVVAHSSIYKTSLRQESREQDMEEKHVQTMR